MTTAARVTWTASALTTTWYRYLVQRRNPDGVTYDTIGHVYTKATTTFDDYAARRGIAETYRVIQEDTNGITSIPSATAAITLPVAFSAALVSNHDPTLNVELEAYDFTYTDPVNRTITWGYGAETAQVDRGQRRGVSFTFTVDLLTGEGPALWEDLKAVNEADQDDIPHFTFLDSFGTRYEVEAIFDSAPLQNIGTFSSPKIECVEVDLVPVEVP